MGLTKNNFGSNFKVSKFKPNDDEQSSDTKSDVEESQIPKDTKEDKKPDSDEEY